VIGFLAVIREVEAGVFHLLAHAQAHQYLGDGQRDYGNHGAPDDGHHDALELRDNLSRDGLQFRARPAEK
jgi:hypothetical protein